jgi:hypothetical protein
MKKVIIIEKLGEIKESNIKKFDKDELFKKCKFKNNENFEKRHTWKFKNNYVSLFAKDTGRGNSENKKDLPPPLDEKLFFGNMIACLHENEELTNDNIKNFSKEEWDKFYEKQFGGFEDLGDESDRSHDEDDEEYDSDMIDDETGYLKNSFIAGDNEPIEKEDSGDEEEESYDFSGDSESDEPSIDSENSELTEEEYDYNKN